MANNAKVSIIGNLTKDPEMRQVGSGNVVSLSVAVSTSRKNQDGSFKSDFYEVSVWGKQGDFLMQRLQKGSGVWITGDLTTDEYVGRDQKTHLVLRIAATDVRGFARLKETGQTGQGKAAPAAKTTSYVSEDNMFPF